MKHTVSNSRVTSFNTCLKQYYFRYKCDLQLRNQDITPYRGVIGHKILEAYYANDKRDRKAAKAVYIEHVQLATAAERIDVITMLADLWILINRYFDYVEEVDSFEVVAVEQKLLTPIDSQTDFIAILDLIIKIGKGKYRGELAVLDHKFVYNFKSQSDLMFDSQQPKYLRVARENGFDVSLAVINQLRVRPLKNPKPIDQFVRIENRISDTRIDNIWEEQRRSVSRMHLFNAGEYPYWGEGFKVLTNAACKYCPFLQICDAELENRDTTNIIRLDYVKRESPVEDDAVLESL